ncbi:Zn-dependent membrane protease YugP [Providencia alcalifaciens]|nr:Zn-dependent membrane protease YugP [Providencia alcalifaciens]
MDMAKLAISAQVSTAIVGGLTTAGLITGGSVIVVSLGIFLLGVAIAYALYKLDDKFKISNTIIKSLKQHRSNKPETPYHPDQFFSQWGRFSYG